MNQKYYDSVRKLDRQLSDKEVIFNYENVLNQLNKWDDFFDVKGKENIDNGCDAMEGLYHHENTYTILLYKASKMFDIINKRHLKI